MTNEIQKPVKVLGYKAYGNIPHLPGSRRGPGDKGLSDQQALILTDKARDKHDTIIVQEKVDGSCMAVAKVNGVIIALSRSGYPAKGSPYYQHECFANWVDLNKVRFDLLLKEGERCVGEWLMQAHGTIYKLKHEPFVLFDIMREHERLISDAVIVRSLPYGFITPRVIHTGDPISIASVCAVLEPSGYGAVDGVEGAVWRVERKGVVDFLGKYVRPDKVDGKYLEHISGKPPVYNWLPDDQTNREPNSGKV